MVILEEKVTTREHPRAIPLKIRLAISNAYESIKTFGLDPALLLNTFVAHKAIHEMKTDHLLPLHEISDTAQQREASGFSAPLHFLSCCTAYSTRDCANIVLYLDIVTVPTLDCVSLIRDACESTSPT